MPRQSNQLLAFSSAFSTETALLHNHLLSTFSLGSHGGNTIKERKILKLAVPDVDRCSERGANVAGTEGEVPQLRVNNKLQQLLQLRHHSPQPAPCSLRKSSS
jgi:hypothetical protein